MKTWQEDFEIFCEWRRTESGKKKFGPVAEKMLLRKCEKFHGEGYDVSAMLAHSAIVGWLSIYPNEDYKRKSKPAAHNEGPQLSIVGVERNEEAAAAGLDAARKAMRVRR